MGLLIPTLLSPRIKGPGVGWASEPSQPCFLGIATWTGTGPPINCWQPCKLTWAALPLWGRRVQGGRHPGQGPSPKLLTPGPDFRVLSQQESGLQVGAGSKNSDVSRALQPPERGAAVIINTEQRELRAGVGMSG